MKKAIIARGALAGLAALALWVMCAVGAEIAEFSPFYWEGEEEYGDE